jgi:hypothetical protein
MINLERFESRCTPDPAGSDCIIWTGVKNNIGYPFMGARHIATDKYKMVTGHRMALTIKLGRPITAGMNANHSCHRKDCVNPDHLFEGTQRQKFLDMARDGIRTGRPASEKIVTCVVYKKPTGKKYYLNTYINFSVDTIITTRKHTPLIPEGFEIVDIGIGKSYIKRYMQQYNIKEVTTKD